MKKYLSPILLLLVVTLTGCAVEPPTRVFWPPPPGELSLEYVGVYYSEDSFEKTASEKFLTTFVGGSEAAYFSRPTGIASNGRGRVYVADQLFANIRIFDFNLRKTQMLSRSSIFARPADLAIDSQKRLYVVDSAAQKVVVFSPNDEFLFAFGSSDLFTLPTYLAVNERLGRIYVSDSKGHKIVVFDLQGKYLFTFGKLGSKEGEFFSPQGVAVNRDNQVFVADQYNARIQVFDADGVYLYHFGERGDGIGQMEMPKALAFDSDGHLYMTDSRRGAVTAYTAKGEPFVYLGGAGKGTSPLEFANPSFMTIDDTDRLHISDMMNQRFVIWQYLSPAYLQAHPVTDDDLRKIMKGNMMGDGVVK